MIIQFNHDVINNSIYDEKRDFIMQTFLSNAKLQYHLKTNIKNYFNSRQFI